MLHVASAKFVSPSNAQPDPHRGNAEDAWLVPSPEVKLGFGRASFLRDQLGSKASQGLVLLYLMGSDLQPASVHICNYSEAMERLSHLHSSLAAVCSSDRSFLAQLGLPARREGDEIGYFLPSELRLLVEAGLFTRLPGRAAAVYRAAKSMELLCETLSLHAKRALVPLAEKSGLSMYDSVKVLAAKRLITERFREKLTLDTIARASGINRAKLTRGFREMFECSISDAILEHRLGYARELVTSSDRPISSVGYDAGYLNNASFARAFHRRFGITPTECRSRARRQAGGLREYRAAA